MKRLRLHILASGSEGNAAIVEDTQSGLGIAIDCGICKRNYFQSCQQIGFDPTNIAALFVTHNHTDHTSGLGVLFRGLKKMGHEPALFANSATISHSKELQQIAQGTTINPLELKSVYSFRDFRVKPLPTSHDVPFSCGFRIECDGDSLGYLTDSGQVLPQAHELLRECRILALESNHDERMLAAGPYPHSLKVRVASVVGHLSNKQAAAELESLLWDGLEQVVALHISQNNNTYVLPKDGFHQVLDAHNHQAQVSCGYQQRITSIE